MFIKGLQLYRQDVYRSVFFLTRMCGLAASERIYNMSRVSPCWLISIDFLYYKLGINSNVIKSKQRYCSVRRVFFPLWLNQHELFAHSFVSMVHPEIFVYVSQR